jgi:hypothetical protein
MLLSKAYLSYLCHVLLSVYLFLVCACPVWCISLFPFFCFLPFLIFLSVLHSPHWFAVVRCSFGGACQLVRSSVMGGHISPCGRRPHLFWVICHFYTGVAPSLFLYHALLTVTDRAALFHGCIQSVIFTCMSPARKPWYTPLFILCGACVCLMFLYLNVSSIHEVCFSMTFSFSCYVGCFQVALHARVINRDLWLTWVPYIVLHTYTNLSALADEWFGASHICSCGRWPPLFEAIFHFYADVILPLLLQYVLLAVASHDAL